MVRAIKWVDQVGSVLLNTHKPNCYVDIHTDLHVPCAGSGGCTLCYKSGDFGEIQL